LRRFEELASQWPTLKTGHQPGLDQSDKIRALEGCLDILLPTADGPRRLRLEVYPLEEDSGEGLLLGVRDLDLIEALEQDLDMAARFGDFAPLQARMATTCGRRSTPWRSIWICFKTSLAQKSAGRPDRRRAQQRYLNVFSEELAG